jgi:hypothetical protein
MCLEKWARSPTWSEYEYQEYTIVTVNKSYALIQIALQEANILRSL